ncbi:MAG: dihydrodipicolinate synthase family protein, partial [Acidimicrobiia bacterium]|nr:dihydrodipicolinate synthase family protein [Acidimicrobiia bacterium]
MAGALAGVFPVFQTPFREDDSIDVDALEAEIEWIHRQGADGVVMAMVSEVLRLSDAERDQLARLSCELGLPHGPVVLSVGAESTSVAISRARRAEDLGATAVMAIPPTSVSAGPDELFGYYRALLDAVAVPVI